MFGMEDFIKCVMNDDLIRADEINFRNDEVEKILSATYKYVSDDYDQNAEFGLFTGDSENARNHLMRILKETFQNKGNLDQMRDKVARDLQNWLKCIDIFEYDSFLPIVFQAMVYAGFGDVVCKQIEEECRSLVKCQNDHWNGYVWKPSYVELYLNLGDYCLFKMADEMLAMRFYHLAAFDWYGLNTNHKEKLSSKRENELKRIDRMVLDLDLCYVLLPLQYGSLRKEIVDTYNRYVSCRESQFTFKELLLEDLLDFVKCRDKYWKDSNTHKKRMLLMISHRMFESSIAEIVLTLYKDKETMGSDVDNRILECLSKSEDIELISISDLVAQYRDNAEIMKSVIFLMKTKFQINEVLRGLKVSKPEKLLAYYTSLDTFCYMLPDWNKSDVKGTGRFSVMNIAYMNDPNEGKALKNAFQKTDRSGMWRQYFANSEGLRKCIEFPYVFMKCFTPLVDDLPMWDMYGDSAKGCCVVLDPRTFFSEENKRKIQLYHVCYISIDGENICVDYENNKQILDVGSIESALEEICDIGIELFQEAKCDQLFIKTSKAFIEMLDQISYLFKNADYKHEQEVRLLYVYPQIQEDFHHTAEKWPKLYVRPDFHIYIKELIMGPKCVETYKFMPYLQEQIAKMCEQGKVDEPKITISNIQYH